MLSDRASPHARTSSPVPRTTDARPDGVWLERKDRPAGGFEYELGRRVIEKTGLAGKYTFELKVDPFSPELHQPVRQIRRQNPLSWRTPTEPRSSALQEQLGLRLESEKSQVEASSQTAPTGRLGISQAAISDLSERFAGGTTHASQKLTPTMLFVMQIARLT